MHYQGLAKDGLEAALARLDEFKQRAGPEAEAPLREMLPLAADCMLQRDKLGASMAQAQARAEESRIECS